MEITMPLREQSIGSVLIIDDEYSMRRILCRFFETRTERVVSASDAASAMEKMREGGYDLAIIDVNIGNENGIELAARLRVLDARLHIIIMSGNPIAEAAAKAAGFSEFLYKPYVLDGLKNFLAL